MQADAAADRSHKATSSRTRPHAEQNELDERYPVHIENILRPAKASRTLKDPGSQGTSRTTPPFPSQLTPAEGGVPSKPLNSHIKPVSPIGNRLQTSESYQPSHVWKVPSFGVAYGSPEHCASNLSFSSCSSFMPVSTAFCLLIVFITRSVFVGRWSTLCTIPNWPSHVDALQCHRTAHEGTHKETNNHVTDSSLRTLTFQCHPTTHHSPHTATQICHSVEVFLSQMSCVRTCPKAGRCAFVSLDGGT